METPKAESQQLGRFGRRYEQSLRENRPALYMEYKKSGELEEHLRAVDEEAEETFQSMLKALLQQSPGPKDAIGQAQHLNVLRNQAEEIVDSQLLVMDEETEKAQTSGYLD